jgi:hypothetical protein
MTIVLGLDGRNQVKKTLEAGQSTGSNPDLATVIFCRVAGET